MSELFQRLRLVSYLLDAIPIILFALTETVIIIYHMALAFYAHHDFFFLQEYDGLHICTGHTYLQ